MRVAVIGATGVVGQMILRVLDEREIALDTLLAYASRDRAEGLVFRGRHVPVVAASIEQIRADRPDVVFFASSDEASREMAEALAATGALVIDNSATFRLDPRVPLIVPEVNPTAIGPDDRIFPVANCTAIVLCVALAPIDRAIGLSAVRVATYQAVSGAGRAGLEALASEEAAALSDTLPPSGGPFAAPIFRNVVPQVGSFDGEGDTGEELKVVAETRKMLGRPHLHLAATTVRVPVRQAHSEAVFFQTSRPTSGEELGAIFAAAPGVVFHPRGIVTPLDVEGTDLVHVARLRPEPDSQTAWQMWIVGDQLRKGAATNAVQILQALIEQGRFALASGAPPR
jgi:aspartate-semialdehyde dehydrogenase